MNEGDQLVTKINFTLDLLIDNYENLQDKMEELNGKTRSFVTVFCNTSSNF